MLLLKRLPTQKGRLKNPDIMLANLLQSKIGAVGELGRLVATKSQNMYRMGNLITGRQIAHILCMRLRTSDEMAMVYSINPLCKVTWPGDTPEQVSRFEGRWEKILDNMGTKLGGDTLRELILEQMSQSKELESGVKTYERESGKKTHEFLMGCIERLLSRSMMESNRQQQIASSSKLGSGIATLAVEGKGKGTTGRGRSRGG